MTRSRLRAGHSAAGRVCKMFSGARNDVAWAPKRYRRAWFISQFISSAKRGRQRSARPPRMQPTAQFGNLCEMESLAWLHRAMATAFPITWLGRLLASREIDQRTAVYIARTCKKVYRWPRCFDCRIFCVAISYWYIPQVHAVIDMTETQG